MINQPKILLTPRSMEETHWTASQAKKKSGARRLKIIGDMYLLTASYEEAIKHLQLALDETRGGSDPIWNVAAQENFHFATALKHENQVIEASLKLANTKIGSNPSIPSLLSRPGSLNSINSSHSLANSSQVSVTWLGLPEKLNQISFIYSKCGLSILAFETHRLIANIFDHAGVPVESTMALCIGWSYSRKMGLKDQLYALSCITDHFSTLGMRRKCAFFFGRLSASLENGDASAGIRGEPYPALAVLKKVFSSYSIDTGNRLDSLQWPRLQIALLDCALTLVCDARASKSLIGEYAFALLSCIGGGDSDFESGKPSNLNETEQIRLANLLRIAQHRGATPTSPLNTALPLLIGLIVISEKKCWKKVHKNQYHFEGAVELDDPFIFRPSNSVSNSSTRFENENLIFAVGEFITIDVFLQNPFAFPIELVALKLCPSLAGSESADNFELDNVNILLPAWCQNIKVSITFRSQISGTVNVSKVSAIVFGIPIVLRCQSVAKSFKTIEIIVIPEQPPVKLADIESLCTIDMKKSISLFNGEASEFSLIFTNLSQNIPVSLLGIRGVHEIDRLACQQGFISAEGVTNSDENDEPLKLSKYQFTESNEVFQGSKISENLVIPPLSQVVFGFDLIGIIGWKKTCIIFEYCGGIGDGSQVYVRTVEYYIESTVKPSIFARSIWIHPNVNELNDCMPKMFPDGIDTKLTTKPLHDLIGEISLKDNYNGGNKLALLILDLVNSSDYTTFRVELEIDGVGASCMSYENNSVIPGATGRFLSIITRQSREKSDRLLQNILDNRLQTVDQNLKTARQKVRLIIMTFQVEIQLSLRASILNYFLLLPLCRIEADYAH